MKHAPAFDFYPERWTHGTRHMTKTERCDYMDLLCHQWTDDGLPSDLDRVARLIGYKKAGQIPAVVLDKFPVAEDGKRRNARLEQERTKQRERFDRKSSGAAKTNAKRWGNGSLSDSHSDRSPNRLATVERVASESPPPTTDHRPVQTPNPPEPPASPSLDGFSLETADPKPKAWTPTDSQLTVARWFNRRDTTPFSEKERKAWKIANPQPADIELLDCYYTADIPQRNDYRRRDLLTLLNNWSGELDRARRFVQTQAEHDDRPTGL